jgi:hypothetical protein
MRRSSPGVQAGPILLTPTRVTLAVALAGSLLYLVYAVSVRDASQIPLLSSGAGVLGIVFCALAISGGYGTYRAAAEGRTGQALGLAIGGGVAGMIAAGCFALALVLALAWRAA